MIFFWFREIAGWLLVALALGLVWTALTYVGNRQVIEAGVVTMISIALLRTGILLVRVSTASRIALRKPAARTER